MHRTGYAIGCLAVMTAGCASMSHKKMNGAVVMASSEQEAHVCLLEGEVTVGDVVRVKHHICEDNSRAGITCRDEDSGRATVTAHLNGHYVAVIAFEGTTLHEGDTVTPL
jgi:hypothetical protein